jgi:hypothetical protein
VISITSRDGQYKYLSNSSRFGKAWLDTDPRKFLVENSQSYFSNRIDFLSQPSDFSSSRLALTIFSSPQM